MIQLDGHLREHFRRKTSKIHFTNSYEDPNLSKIFKIKDLILKNIK